MKMPAVKPILMIVAAIALCSCNTWMNQSSNDQPKGITVADDPEGSKMGIMSGEQVARGGAIGGNLEGSMDEADKSKLSKALDGGLGKASHWVNSSTGISYTATPVQKVTVGGNSFCRTYNLSAEKGSQSNRMSGTACLESDGAWHRV